ncbi:spore gernimation protein [Sporosarcina sp. P12(2017)]|uniref:GerAB/ArcD/ProY family transporter n=1 Tax=unclassified Sporosarcina TaxID=2647733 RepID=UPI000C16E0EF|nr:MULTISPECIES: endospore germination permease [unclassified Sporosarcina]PIC57995.1 spore gernimation protein [Sporosarcina sp. P10]PIC61378.1 spore gernimation protein [Sporosarcina sp. P12(2017)]
MQNIKINPYQFLVLVIFFTVGTGILIIPSALAAEAKQDAWIAVIVGIGISLLVIWLFTTIALWFPHLNYIQINEKLFGKWIGKTVSVLFVIMATYYTSSLLYYSATFVATNILPNTPMVALHILMIGIVVMGIHLGLETIARSAEILIVVFVVLFLILVVFISPQIKFENLQPVFEVGTKMIFQSSIYFVTSSTVNAIVLLMIFPALINKMKQAKKSFLIGHLIGGIFIFILTFLSVSVLGAEDTARQIYPGYELAKRISVGDFVQRIEGLMGSLWFIALYFKTVLYFYASILGITQILNLKDYRPLTVPLGMLAVILALVIYPNVVYQNVMEQSIEIVFSMFIGLLFPLLLVIVYAFRKNKLKKEPDSS